MICLLLWRSLNVARTNPRFDTDPVNADHWLVVRGLRKARERSEEPGTRAPCRINADTSSSTAFPGCAGLDKSHPVTAYTNAATPSQNRPDPRRRGSHFRKGGNARLDG